jgi:hypothetical protein
MLPLYITSLAIFTTYIVILMRKCGKLTNKFLNIPLSISESSYIFGNKLIFWAWKVLYISPLMVFWLSLTKDQPQQFSVFLACAGLYFAGITGDFHGKTTMESKVHTTGTLICAMFAQLWMWLTIPFSWGLSVLLLPLGWFGIGPKVAGLHMYAGKDKPMMKKEHGGSRIFWCEIFLFIMAYASVLSYYLSKN